MRDRGEPGRREVADARPLALAAATRSNRAWNNSGRVKEYPYWWDTHPAVGTRQSTLSRPPASCDPGQRPRCDVAVIGGGYTGLSAALYLAKIGATVVVLERERIGWGASSRNGGQVLTGLKLDPATLVSRYGERAARELFELSLNAIGDLESLIGRESLDCEFERTGHIQAAAKPKHFDAFRTEQALLDRVFHHAVTLVTRREQAA